MRLAEIDYTGGIDTLSVPLEQMMQSATVVGDLDNRDVLYYQHGAEEAFFVFTESDKAVLIVEKDRLRRVANYSNTPGLITMLVGFLTHRLQRPLRIDKTEQLTNSGITWLCKLLRAKGRGLTITDQNGNFPDADQVYAEWEHQMTQPGCGPTNIFIESKMIRYLKTRKEIVAENSLIVHQWFIGDENIL